MKRLKNKHYLFLLALLFLAVALPRLRFPDLDHGDDYADANVLNAGENFVRFGFIRCRFLPMFEPHLDTPQGLYTHYPPLSEIVNGLERKLFKTDSLTVFRSVSLVFSFLAVLFWYYFITIFTGSSLLGFVSSLFFLFNPLFIFCIDSLHQFAYAELLRALIFYLSIGFVRFPEKRKIFLPWLGLAFFLISLFTFEYIIYFYLFFFLFRFLSKEARRAFSLRVLFLLMLAPIVGFVLHLIQNLWYFGNVHSVVQDLKNVAIERIARSKDSALDLSFGVWWQFVIARNFSLVLMFNYYVLSFFGLLSVVLYQRLSAGSKIRIKPLGRLCLVLAACGLTWYIFFPSHSVAHTFLTFMSRHLVPVAVLAYTMFFYVCFSYLRENNPKNTIGKIVLGLIAVFVLNAGVTQSDIPVTSDSIARARDFLVFKEYLYKLKDRSSPKDEVGVNYFRHPFLRFYTHRHVLVVFNKAGLQELPSLPRYFILLLRNDPRNLELFEFLKEKYELIFQCPSQRFPALFLELKK